MIYSPITTVRELLDQHSDALIFQCVAGSHAYGLARPHSDRDFRGVYALPTAAYLALTPPVEQVADARGDEVYYALRRFVELATSANPNIIELLYMPDDCVLQSSPYWQRLSEARDRFLSKQAYESHVGYAMAQIRKARGQNKWINNPQPKEPPRKEDFCWFVPREGSAMARPEAPLRPIALAEAAINLAECHAAALEHCPGVYRLYHYGAEARGVFRGEVLVCESIPKADESTRCIGLLIFNEQAWEKAMKDHQNYWTWRRNRNVERYVSQERGEIDYDAKNLMHTFRLILSAEQIFTEGQPLVRFAGEPLHFLRSVRAGEFRYEDLIQQAEERVAHLAKLRDQSPLPESPDLEAIAQLLGEITAMWEADNPA